MWSKIGRIAKLALLTIATIVAVAVIGVEFGSAFDNTAAAVRDFAVAALEWMDRDIVSFSPWKLVIYPLMVIGGLLMGGEVILRLAAAIRRLSARGRRVITRFVPLGLAASAGMAGVTVFAGSSLGDYRDGLNGAISDFITDNVVALGLTVMAVALGLAALLIGWLGKQFPRTVLAVAATLALAGFGWWSWNQMSSSVAVAPAAAPVSAPAPAVSTPAPAVSTPAPAVAIPAPAVSTPAPVVAAPVATPSAAPAPAASTPAVSAAEIKMLSEQVTELKAMMVVSWLVAGIVLILALHVWLIVAYRRKVASKRLEADYGYSYGYGYAEVDGDIEVGEAAADAEAGENPGLVSA